MSTGILSGVRGPGSGDRIPVEVRFSSPVQTGPGVHPASCTMDTGVFPGVKSGRGVTLTPHPLLVLWSRKSRAIPLLPLWAVRPAQSLSACTKVHTTLLLIITTTQLHNSRKCHPSPLWKGMKKISLTKRVENEKLLKRIKEEMHFLITRKQWKANWIGRIFFRYCLLKRCIE